MTKKILVSWKDKMISEPIKIIFLDFDGVIVFGQKFDSEKIKVLNALVAQTNALVVISSDWRLYYSRAKLCDFLNHAGFNGTILGTTPNLGLVRGLEIKHYIESCRFKIESFVIFDDNDYFDSFGSEFFIETLRGLQEEHCQQAISILSKPSRVSNESTKIV